MPYTNKQFWFDNIFLLIVTVLMILGTLISILAQLEK